MNEKAEKLRQEAAELEHKKQESWERSDTDGFLSQWALGLIAQLKRRQAEIEEQGGTWLFRCLMEGDRRVDAKAILGKYGTVWLLSDDEANCFGRRFVPFEGDLLSGDRGSRIQRKLGLHEDYENAPAKAYIDGSGTGLSGNAWVSIKRTDGK